MADLSGKIVLDSQPFGELRNMYETESGFCISKYMIIEVVVAILLFITFSWVAGKIRSGTAPKGRVWNLFEVFLLFIRDQIARPALGSHHEEHEHEHPHSDPSGVKEGHAIGGAGLGGKPAEVDHPRAESAMRGIEGGGLAHAGHSLRPEKRATWPLPRRPVCPFT